MASGPITSWQIEGEKVEAVTDFLFLGSEITVDGDCRHEIRRWLFLGQESYDKLDSVLKSKDITLLTKVHIVKAMVFQNWTIKKAERQRIDAFKLWCWKTLESPLDSKEIKSVNPKGNSPWIFIARTNTEAEAPTVWPPDTKSWHIGKDPDAGKGRGQEEKGAMHDEMGR